MPTTSVATKVFFDDVFIETITAVEFKIHQPIAEKPDPYMAALYARAFAPTLEQRLAPISGSPRAHVEFEPSGPKEWSGSFNAPIDFCWIGKRIHLRIEGGLSGEIVIDSSATDSSTFIGIGVPQS